MLPFLRIQRQQCIKFRVLGAQDFYTPLPLNCQKKGQHLPAPEGYKNQSPKKISKTFDLTALASYRIENPEIQKLGEK